jgi:predicted SAM-dependent methyltransferase
MKRSISGCIKDMVKARTTYALRRTVRDLLEEFRVSRRHHISLNKAKRWSGEIDLKLNVGCGSNLKPGWVNIDAGSDDAELQLDLREPLPFRDGSAAIVYSEHFFEHLEYPLEASGFLTESWRVLIPGGTFSMGIPDFELFVNSYVTRDERFYRELFQYRQPEWIRSTRMHVLNWIFRLGREHKYAYDFETIATILGTAGFVKISRRQFDPDLDSETRKWGTMYIEAQKPAVTCTAHP